MRAIGNTTNFYGAREGEYIEVSNDEIAKYLPEGLAGETKDEFDLTRQNQWMVRSSSKIMCRLLDRFAEISAGKVRQTLPKNVNAKVVVSGLTDKSEWDAALPSIQTYSKEIMNYQNTLESDIETSQGEGSVVEETLAACEEVLTSPSRSIMLMGTYMPNRSVLFHHR